MLVSALALVTLSNQAVSGSKIQATMDAVQAAALKRAEWKGRVTMTSVLPGQPESKSVAEVVIAAKSARVSLVDPVRGGQVVKGTLAQVWDGAAIRESGIDAKFLRNPFPTTDRYQAVSWSSLNASPYSAMVLVGTATKTLWIDDSSKGEIEVKGKNTTLRWTIMSGPNYIESSSFEYETAIKEPIRLTYTVKIGVNETRITQEFARAKENKTL